MRAYRGNRRRFLKTTVALASSFAVPQLVPRSVFGAAAPSNRINIGIIGCGHQSQRDVPSFLVHDDVQIVAVCDVNRAGKGYYYPERVLGRETARRWIDEYYAEKASGGDPKATIYERLLGPRSPARCRRVHTAEGFRQPGQRLQRLQRLPRIAGADGH